jgi:hypothetical protein
MLPNLNPPLETSLTIPAVGLPPFNPFKIIRKIILLACSPLYTGNVPLLFRKSRTKLDVS